MKPRGNGLRQPRQVANQEIAKVVNRGNVRFEVQLIDETNENRGSMPFTKAMALAEDAGFDLVLVSRDQRHAVCRIMDHGKAMYEFKRRAKEQRKKAKEKSKTLKQIRSKSRVEQNDLQRQIDKAMKFLSKGHPVRYDIQMMKGHHGRFEVGLELLREIAERVKHKISSSEVVVSDRRGFRQVTFTPGDGVEEINMIEKKIPGGEKDDTPGGESRILRTTGDDKSKDSNGSSDSSDEDEDEDDDGWSDEENN